MNHYKVDPAKSIVVVKARSSIHDTTTTWNKISGTIEATADTLESNGAIATIDVDMTSFDAGDWLKNRKLKKDLDVTQYPLAQFELSELTEVVGGDGGEFKATAVGKLRWRSREVTVTAPGTGIVNDDGIDARATFELDVTDLGVKPPKILMFKVEKVVAIEVILVAPRVRS